VRYGVLCGLCAIATISYIQRQSLGTAESSIREELNLSKEQMGWVMTAFFATYAVFQIPSGAMVRTWGVRRALPWFSVLFSLLCGLFAGCTGWTSLIAARLGMGVSQAGIFPASTTAVAQWFPRAERALPNGTISGFMQVGGALGAMLTGWLIVTIGWRWMFVCYALPGLIWAVWFYGWYRDSPEDNPSANVEPALPKPGFSSEKPDFIPEDQCLSRALPVSTVNAAPTPWMMLITNRSMAGICCQQFCRAGAAMFFGSWFATYLKETRGVSLVGAGLLTSIPMWSMMLGSFVGGYASDFVFRRTGSLDMARRGIAVCSMIFCASLASGAYFVDDPVLATLLIGAGSFWASVAGPCAYSITIDVGGRHVPAVFSTMNMFGNIGAAVFPILVPLFLDATGSWDLVLFLFVGLYVLAAAFWLLADAAKPIFDEV
jgi:ACS family glucarate transporter-like MFS transporter